MQIIFFLIEFNQMFCYEQIFCYSITFVFGVKYLNSMMNEYDNI